jgi:hypothetical protein
VTEGRIQYIDNQKLVGGELTFVARQTFFISRFEQLVDQDGCDGEAEGETLLAGGRPSGL